MRTWTPPGTGPDVDVVLTTRELGRMLKAQFINVRNLPEEEFDMPLGEATGAGHIFGATGGVMEAALRSAHFLVTGENPDPDAFSAVRGCEGWREVTYNLAGKELTVAIVSGLQNADNLCNAIENGEVDYDFVEVMACPGGCVGGGGQPSTRAANAQPNVNLSCATSTPIRSCASATRILRSLNAMKSTSANRTPKGQSSCCIPTTLPGECLRHVSSKHRLHSAHEEPARSSRLFCSTMATFSSGLSKFREGIPCSISFHAPV